MGLTSGSATHHSYHTLLDDTLRQKWASMVLPALT
jgi:hypothetical protein